MMSVFMFGDVVYGKIDGLLIKNDLKYGDWGSKLLSRMKCENGVS